MSKEKECLIERAHNLSRKGKNLEAISIYAKALELDPRDIRIIFKLAELCAETQDVTRAVQYYLSAAAYLKKDGFYSRAVPALKQVLVIDANCIKAREELVDLYDKLNLVQERDDQREHVTVLKAQADVQTKDALVEKEKAQREIAKVAVEAAIAQCQLGDQESEEFLKALYIKIEGAICIPTPKKKKSKK